MLCTSTRNEYCSDLLNVGPSNLDFDKVTSQNGRPLETAEKVNLTLIISK